jgi:single-stranded DNA-binding protein
MPCREEVPLLDDATAPQEASQPSSPQSAERQEQQERIQLAGRLGTDIRYRTTRSGKLIAKFPLAIKQEDGSTKWKDVKVFGERAAKLQAGDQLRRGQYTEITGYVHQREVTRKDGTTRTVEEIYAVVVKPR